MSDQSESGGEDQQNVLMVSGGKDSTYLIKYCLENGIPIDRCVFFDTTLHLPLVYDWIDELEQQFGIQIDRVKPKWDFEEKFYQVHEEGNDAGEIWGFPYVSTPCWIRRDLKVNNEQIDGTAVLGYTADEPDRDLQRDYIAPLRDNNITAGMVVNRLKEAELYPPLYDLLERYGIKKPRSGCYLCPKAPIGWFRMLYHEFPEYWEQTKEYAEDDPKQFRTRITIDELE